MKLKIYKLIDLKYFLRSVYRRRRQESILISTKNLKGAEKKK